MSQSPLTADELDREGEYIRSWNALGELIKRGKSFSGRERNCVFLNTGGPEFADVSAVTQLDYPDDGRCVGLLDWDLDGDLDLWLVNRTAPRVRLLRNDWANANRHLSVRLVGQTCNRDAIGARVEVELDQGPRLVETVRAGDGFLTQSSKWLHFGTGGELRVRRLRVRWPGTTTWEAFPDLATNARYEIVQGSGRARRADDEEIKSLVAAPQQPPAESTASRVMLTARVPLAETTYQSFAGEPRSLLDHQSGPLLVNFWGSWCSPCLQELKNFSAHTAAFQEAGLTILPLCVDALDGDRGDLAAPAKLLQQLNMTSPAGMATPELTAGFTHLLSWIFYRQRPLPLPSSFLLDAEGKLAAVYRGNVSADQVLEDVRLLEQSTDALLAREFPGTGRFLFPQPGMNPLALVRAYREGGYFADAKQMLQETLEQAQQQLVPRNVLVTLFRELSQVEAELGNSAGVVAACREAMELDPNEPALAIALAVALASNGQREAATQQLERLAESARDDVDVQKKVGHAWLSMRNAARASKYLSRVIEQRPNDIETRFQLATCLQMQGDWREARIHFEEVLDRDPTHVQAANNLAWVFATSRDASVRDGARAVALAEQACQLTEFRAPVFLGTLSAAYAEIGDFDRAIDTARRAVKLAKANGQQGLAADLEKRLRLHEQELPYHEAAAE